MGGGDKKQVVSCIVASILLLLIRLSSILLIFRKNADFLEGRTVGGKMGGGDKKQFFLIQRWGQDGWGKMGGGDRLHCCKRVEDCVLLSSILLIFRKNADSANFFSKVGLLGEKWVVAIKIRWCPALLQKSRFYCFSFIRS